MEALALLLLIILFGAGLIVLSRNAPSKPPGEPSPTRCRSCGELLGSIGAPRCRSCGREQA